MKQFIILLGLLNVALATSGNITGIPTVAERIVGGFQVSIWNYPYQAALLRNGALLCGGVIIGPDTILTAAQCVVPQQISNIAQLTIRVGSSQWRYGGKLIAARRIIYHEWYRHCLGCYPDFDIAVVKLAESINVPSAVSIKMVDDNEQFLAGTYGFTLGWGVTQVGAVQGSEYLRRVSVPVVSQNQCQRAYGNIISYRTICAGYSYGGKDSCQGDGGGPFIINGRLAGIVSFGYGCANPNFPGVYSSVAGYRQWIRQHSGI